MSSLIADLRFAVRSFVRQPGATALVVFTLGLAVAANTAVFALVDAVFFRSLPYPHANRLVDLNEQAPSWGLEFTGVNYADFDAWRKNTRTFAGMALWDDAAFNVSDGNGAARLDGQFVTYDMPAVLDIKPVIGRAFTKEEDVPKGPNVVMIGYGLWQTRFAGSRDVLGGRELVLLPPGDHLLAGDQFPRPRLWSIVDWLPAWAREVRSAGRKSNGL